VEGLTETSNTKHQAPEKHQTSNIKKLGCALGGLKFDV
jgi:hypothetical protein